MTKPARTRLLPADRRAQLMDHAIACFADHGIARATHTQVAARAGVSVSAVYSYFRTRADLVAAVLGAVGDAIKAMLAAAARPGVGVEEALGVVARHTADMAVTQPDAVRVWLDWSTGVRADTWPRYLVLQAELQAHVEAILQPAAPDAARRAMAARLFVGGAHTLALLRFERVEEAQLALFIELMVGGTLAAIAPLTPDSRPSA